MNLQSSDDECVPERVKLGATIVQHPRQPGMQSLKLIINTIHLSSPWRYI